MVSRQCEFDCASGDEINVKTINYKNCTDEVLLRSEFACAVSYFACLKNHDCKLSRIDRVDNNFVLQKNQTEKPDSLFAAFPAIRLFRLSFLTVKR